MATSYGKGKANVAKASKPDAKATPKAMTNAHVGKNVSKKHVSSGKMASGGKVSLGTTHGNHSVNHPL